MAKDERVDILGVKVSIINDSNVIDHIIELVTKKRQIQITTPNAEQILMAGKNEQFRRVINQSDLAIPDGMSIVRVIRNRVKNKSLVSRVTGVDLVVKLCELASQKKWKIGLMGASKEVREKTVINLNRKFRKLEVVFLKSHQNVKKSKIEDGEILKDINKNKIDILLVAYGAPEQELWINQNLKKTQVRIGMGVGGAFDFLSGKIKRAPGWWQKNGLEWLWRLIQEPWRIKRQIKLINFWWKIMRDDNLRI